MRVLAILFCLVLALPAQAAPAVDWPAAGRIVFRIYHGGSGLVLGRTTHSWQHANGRYSMQSLVETSGMAALFADFHYLQKSEGRVSAAGLRPERFTVDQRGKPFQSARFDWQAGEVFIDRGDSKRQAKLAAGDQDILSIWHQLARQPLADGTRTLTVVSNKAAKVSQIRELGAEKIKLPLGEVSARHLTVKSADGSVNLDLWLAEGRHLLPVRIRIEDKKGGVLDQQAERIEIPPAEGGT